MIHISKAIIPAAGLGTRFLPITKVIAKELLPILEKPAIHYVVQEAMDASLTDICFIISKEKEALRHYFEPNNAALQQIIEQKKLQKRIAATNELIGKGTYSYRIQEHPQGLGHAVLQARDFVAHQLLCAVLLPDDILVGSIPAIAQLSEIALAKNATVLAVMQVTPDKVSSYGMVSIKQALSDRLFELNHIVEKPAIGQAPSEYAVIGRYILTPDIFDALMHIKPGAQGELQLTDAITYRIDQGKKVFACVVDNKRFDTGTPYGWLEANCYYAQQQAGCSPLCSHFNQ